MTQLTDLMVKGNCANFFDEDFSLKKKIQLKPIKHLFLFFLMNMLINLIEIMNLLLKNLVMVLMSCKDLEIKLLIINFHFMNFLKL